MAFTLSPFIIIQQGQWTLKRMSRDCGGRWESPRKNARANMFSKGQLNRVLKWEKPWQIYLHARMAPTWPLLEEQNTEKRQQASLERWFYGPLAGKPTRPFRLRHNFGLRSFLAPVSFCCLMAASVCSGHQHFSQVIPVPSFKTSSFVISDWRLYWRDSLDNTKPVCVLLPLV